MNPLKNPKASHYKAPKPIKEVIDNLAKTGLWSIEELEEASKALTNDYETIDLAMLISSKEELLGWAKINIIKYMSRNKDQDELDNEKIRDYKNFAKWIYNLWLT